MVYLKFKFQWKPCTLLDTFALPRTTREMFAEREEMVETKGYFLPYELFKYKTFRF